MHTFEATSRQRHSSARISWGYFFKVLEVMWPLRPWVKLRCLGFMDVLFPRRYGNRWHFKVFQRVLVVWTINSTDSTGELLLIAITIVWLVYRNMMITRLPSYIMLHLLKKRTIEILVTIKLHSWAPFCFAGWFPNWCGLNSTFYRLHPDLCSWKPWLLLLNDVMNCCKSPHIALVMIVILISIHFPYP